ncbi:MAG: archaemetzincin family Zn-dependent metalloprotease [Chloroflexi bacterium]|nr:archaemetzincin family Zn-dependent metalloprotease [Chloroflexota bacterium]
MDRTIVLVAVGEIDEGVLTCLREEVAKAFGGDCHVGNPVPSPTYAFNPKRQQYSARVILPHLSCGNAERVLGLVDQDLYVPSLNFVFGLADLPARRALVALPRLRESFYGRPDDEARFRLRVIKEGLHELWHTYGLRHCRDLQCVMAFSNSLEDTDVKGQMLCIRCRKRIPG